MKIRFIPFLLALVFTLLPWMTSLATVDEAHDHTMEAAMPFVDQGYVVREDYWNGEVESGQKLAVRHQLFKGNSYVFWLGTANDNCELELAIYDQNGKEIHTNDKKAEYTKTVRITPPRTGTYTIVFQVTSKKKERGVTWALSYGYR